MTHEMSFLDNLLPKKGVATPHEYLVECYHLSLARSTLEYRSIVWDPYLQKDIDKLENVQRQATRFITRNYISMEQGCVSQMLAELDLPPLQDRRKENR